MPPLLQVEVPGRPRCRARRGHERDGEQRHETCATFILSWRLDGFGHGRAGEARLRGLDRESACRTGTTSEIVAKISGGSLIDAKDCSEGWCAVTWQEKSGFAIQTALDMSGRVPRVAARPPAYRPNAGYVVDDEPVYDAPPPVYYYDGPYYRPYWGWRRHSW